MPFAFSIYGYLLVHASFTVNSYQSGTPPLPERQKTRARVSNEKHFRISRRGIRKIQVKVIEC